MLNHLNQGNGTHSERRDGGFTFLELLVAMVILCVLIALSIPAFSSWLPGHRLKSAASDLYASMQLAKMEAIKADADWAIVFKTSTNSYLVCSDDGGDGIWTDGDETIEKTVNLADYESGVAFGHGTAGTPVDATFDDEITYASNVVVFNPRGTASAGHAYLQNDDNTVTYAVGTRSSGVVRLLKWSDTASDWE